MMSSAVLRSVPTETSIGRQRRTMGAAGRSTPPGGGRGEAPRLHTTSGQPLRVLIVDDDPAVATVLQDMVTEAGGQSVGVITSALAAIGATAVISPDVVLMDVRLPGSMDGVEATEVIRARRSAAVVIITGAGADPNIRARLTALEGVEVVFKPVLHDELCAAILRAARPVSAG
jgi:CheY-like chemotaxis protein